jgi:hypothetical protein
MSIRSPLRVTSSCLCNWLEGAGFPIEVESLEDGVDDAIDVFDIDKADHGTSSTPHFHKAALNHVGSAQLVPQASGKAKNDSNSGRSCCSRRTMAG